MNALRHEPSAAEVAAKSITLDYKILARLELTDDQRATLYQIRIQQHQDRKTESRRLTWAEGMNLAGQGPKNDDLPASIRLTPMEQMELNLTPDQVKMIREKIADDDAETARIAQSVQEVLAREVKEIGIVGC